MGYGTKQARRPGAARFMMGTHANSAPSDPARLRYLPSEGCYSQSASSKTLSVVITVLLLWGLKTNLKDVHFCSDVSCF